ncbi:hypothetical protein B0T26DRAFT_753137 [Lasiosphaeria miniovina]|uniref:Uncharacterized protein n=1 Tax=Lasiosphaeria miniovina TaxID=1954250 RepID=A0AA40ABQ6_9PEZI|nr:uncharacterized protein B0T26DRAFT_753137 [Lasiosphaeria miniovina]KAK0712965.1 hypothetical protein B0T26DRAFT_753137 [Lasiosphaeria miniovina]
MVSTSRNSITVASGQGSSDASSRGSSPVAAAAVAAAAEKGAVEVVRPASPLPNNGNAVAVVPVTQTTSNLSYENSNLDEIMLRQLSEDIMAYNHDVDFCKAQLEDPDLTPQEARTLQLRTLDLGHQIRHCQHRIETLQVQLHKQGTRFRHQNYGTTMMITAGNGAHISSNGKPRASTGGGGTGLTVKHAAISTPILGKRAAPAVPAAQGEDDDDDGAVKRPKISSSPDYEGVPDADGAANTTLQRLGMWRCRLCSAPKYLLAGSGRSPAAPCKWPLKDISKMITHFTEMHTEHTPAERCTELGTALSLNRGPFEYWLRRTRAQNVGDGSIINDCINSLLSGQMPGQLRRLSRAAAGMPS